MSDIDLTKRKEMINELNDLAVKINDLIRKRQDHKDRLKEVKENLKKIEEEERVKSELYKRMGIKYESKIQELSRQEKEIDEQIQLMEKDISDITKQFLSKFEPDAYPLLDLENPEVKESQVVFPIKEGYRLSKIAYVILMEQTWNTTQNSLGDVKFEEDRWIIDTNETIEAMKKVKAVLDILENSVRNILNLDKICERIHKSKSWGPALQFLYVAKKPLSPKEVAIRLGWKENYAGATLTDLMKKKFWPVSLVERPSEGVYQLNGHGYIMMKQYEQLYGIPIEKEQRYAETSPLKKEKTLENFMKNI